jgi:hypothetical protein
MIELILQELETRLNFHYLSYDRPDTLNFSIGLHDNNRIVVRQLSPDMVKSNYCVDVFYGASIFRPIQLSLYQKSSSGSRAFMSKSEVN